MRALQAEVVDAAWAAVEPLTSIAPQRATRWPCHWPRVPDRLCFWGILIRLVTGCSWVSVEAILEHKISDTTLRARRDEWIVAGIFDQLRDHAMVPLTGSSASTSPRCRSTAPSIKRPVVGRDRQKSNRSGQTGMGMVHRHRRQGIPIGWAIDGAHRNDAPPDP
jgi:hypothetical protein